MFFTFELTSICEFFFPMWNLDDAKYIASDTRSQIFLHPMDLSRNVHRSMDATESTFMNVFFPLNSHKAWTNNWWGGD